MARYVANKACLSLKWEFGLHRISANPTESKLMGGFCVLKYYIYGCCHLLMSPRHLFHMICHFFSFEIILQIAPDSIWMRWIQAISANMFVVHFYFTSFESYTTSTSEFPFLLKITLSPSSSIQTHLLMGTMFCSLRGLNLCPSFKFHVWLDIFFSFIFIKLRFSI